jgi:hypothetical protein
VALPNVPHGRVGALQEPEVKSIQAGLIYTKKKIDL